MSFLHSTMTTAAAILGLWLAPACSRAGDACRSVADCSSGESCVGPDDAHACGIAPEQICASTADCPGAICSAVDDICSASGIGSTCGPACTATSCDVGLRCNAQGACEPIPCDDGFTCPVYQRCDAAVAHAPGAVYDSTQGCVSIDCSSDAACPATTVCVNGVCQTAPGACRVVEAVP